MTRSIFSKDYQYARKEMVEDQIKPRGIEDKAVLNALLKTPRHLFVEPEHLICTNSDFAPTPKSNYIQTLYCCADE